MLGVLAPTEVIDRARALAEQTGARRAHKRADAAVRRARAEERYRSRFEDAVFRFLDFAPPYEGLAREIAGRATEQATDVGSGRVGRTSRLALQAKAELAARAVIRHESTAYERELAQNLLPMDESGEAYRAIRARANAAVEAFLAEHRSPG